MARHLTNRNFCHLARTSNRYLHMRKCLFTSSPAVINCSSMYDMLNKMFFSLLEINNFIFCHRRNIRLCLLFVLVCKRRKAFSTSVFFLFQLLCKYHVLNADLSLDYNLSRRFIRSLRIVLCKSLSKLSFKNTHFITILLQNIVV